MFCVRLLSNKASDVTQQAEKAFELILQMQLLENISIFYQLLLDFEMWRFGT